MTPATNTKKAKESPLLIHSSPNQCQNGSNVHGYRGEQGWGWGQTSLLMANLGKSSWIMQRWLPRSTKKTVNHHFLSNEDQINVKLPLMYDYIEASEVSYEEKWMHSWRITGKSNSPKQIGNVDIYNGFTWFHSSYPYPSSQFPWLIINEWGYKLEACM